MPRCPVLPGNACRFGVLILACLAGVPLRGESGTEISDQDFFEKRVRPLLVQRCEKCHSAAQGKTRGGLALDSAAGWKAGGENGSAVVSGKPAESLLIRAVEYKDEALQMPPEDAGGKLTEAEIEALREWIRRGAPDPRVARTAGRGGLSEEQLRAWWSFQQVKAVSPPDVAGPTDIDRFLLARLNAAGLPTAPEADRRTLIRRMTYDLTGLPPTHDDVDAFVADRSPEAYSNLVERLLASPHYGERWGRHWLDLVRYADTAGENSDHPVPDAWRYRNWVIDAVNRDLPYDQFVREQLAGDQLHASAEGTEYANGIIATGFLAISRRFDHDSDKSMHLTFEDTLDTVGKVFLGLSLGCARCHDHKFDPLSMADYYALYGILGSTRFSFPGCEAKQQPRDLVPLATPAEWERVIAPHEREVAALDAELRKTDDTRGKLAMDLSQAVTDSLVLLANGEVPDGGEQMFIAKSGDSAEIDIAPGHMLRLVIDPAGNYGADTTIIDWKIEQSNDDAAKQALRWNLTDVVDGFLKSNPLPDRQGHAGVWMWLDGRGPGTTPLAEVVTDIQGKSGLHAWRTGDNPAVLVNATDAPIAAWTALPPKTVFVHPAPDGPVTLAWVSPIAGRIRVSGRVKDGHPGGPTGVNWRLELVARDVSAVVRGLSEAGSARNTLVARRAALVAKAPPREFAYAVTDGTVSDARLHLRGDPEKPGDPVPRRWLELFGGQMLPQGAGSGRIQLGEWLSDPRNPLVARVMVNRIWQRHFGRGLVATPNDFGTRGAAPSHPELLDWLAVRFVESGWSLKAMHRLMLHTAAYRRGDFAAGSPNRERALAADPENVLLWRFDRRRLSAEELRDSLLAVSGRLDLSTGTNHPIPPSSAWSFTQHVPFAGVPETDRRTVYQLVVRNRRHPFLALFDGADPNATTPDRQVTTVPTQSLFFLNDPQFHARAEELARRILTQPTDAERINVLCHLTLQRGPTPSERSSTERFLKIYRDELPTGNDDETLLAAWSACARIILAGNEFLYVD